MKVVVRKTTIEEVILDLDEGAGKTIQEVMDTAEAFTMDHITHNDIYSKKEGPWVAVVIDTRD